MAKEIIEFAKKNIAVIISVIFMSGAVYAGIQADRKHVIDELKSLAEKDSQIKHDVDQVNFGLTEALLDSTEAMTGVKTTLSNLVVRVGKLEDEQKKVAKAVSKLQGRLEGR